MRSKRHALTLSGITFWLFAEALFSFLIRLERKLDNLMAFVKVDSDKLTEIEQELSSVSDGVQALIDSPDNNLTVDDLSGITGPLDALRDKLSAVQNPPAGG